ncbi:MAG: hypothetical protein CL908_07495 [Deltaproteobacteria bacterium]|nr:hypothetical protein [Deltaproteobacteria bacterium]
MAVFETVEAAVMDALAHAHHHADLRDRGRFRVGTVYRIAGGFRYTPAVRSRQTVWATAAPVVRYALRTADVASYVIHPRSGRSEVDRLNERPSSAERRIVDDLDPRGRPLYLLTPSRRVVRYVGGQEARIPAIAVFGHGLPDCDESGSAIGSVASPAP